MICKNCNKEMGYNAAFCPECGAKAESIENVQTNQMKLNIGQPNVTEDVILSPAEAAAKAKEDRQNTIIGLVFVGIVIAVIIFVFSLIFGNDIELDEDSVLSNPYGSISNVEFELRNSGINVSGDVTANESGASNGFVIAYSVYDEDDRIIADDIIYTVDLGANETGTFSGFALLEDDAATVKITGFYLQ